MAERRSDDHVDGILRAALQGAYDKGYEQGIIAGRDESHEALDDLKRRLAELSAEVVAPSEALSPASARMMEADIEELDLDSRTYISLKRGGVTTVRRLLELSTDTLLDIPGIGDTRLRRLDQWLADFGLYRTDKTKRS